MINPQVRSVKPLPPHRLLLEFSNGEQRIFDVEPYLSRGVFGALRNPNTFAAVRVIAGSVEWPGAIDLSYDTLYLESALESAPNKNEKPQSVA